MLSRLLRAWAQLEYGPHAATVRHIDQRDGIGTYPSHSNSARNHIYICVIMSLTAPGRSLPRAPTDPPPGTRRVRTQRRRTDPRPPRWSSPPAHAAAHRLRPRSRPGRSPNSLTWISSNSRPRSGWKGCVIRNVPSARPLSGAVDDSFQGEGGAPDPLPQGELLLRADFINDADLKRPGDALAGGHGQRPSTRHHPGTAGGPLRARRERRASPLAGRPYRRLGAT